MNRRTTRVMNQPADLDPRIDFLAGTVAGAAGLLAGQPLDTVKVRFQSPQYKGRYPSTWSAIRAIVKEESPRGLFKGVTSPMAGIAFINGVIFTSYGFFMRLPLPLPGLGPPASANGTSNGGEGEPSLLRIGLAGAGSGFVASFLSAPTELIKIRQQSAPTNVSPTTVGVLRSIVRTEGLRGLYRGWGATAGRELAYGPYFITYEGLCRYFRSRKKPDYASSNTPNTPYASHFTDPHAHGHPHSRSSSLSEPPLMAYTTDVATAHKHAHGHGHGGGHDNLIREAEAEMNELSWGELMLAGGLAGMVSWTATFPLDVLKTRIQSVQPDSTGKVPGRISIITAAKSAVRADGIRVFWSGLAPTLIRAFPANCVVFLTFEAIVAACR
ncbi:mitochondrial carrier domain-containing protein [Filobasidium floriforme]|uniref:mitochondrial carrier domain-containing protein n=1 Tax=Filobasidium floriforme TaxID=5210 RepID=UPI001E8CB2EE|nr:mitochondrial carrier domain-containing protein [Filobasidium floriforme]KAH8087279.1 mitochondrial carrier domain-containing protein [Filobasidium floriforme]